MHVGVPKCHKTRVQHTVFKKILGEKSPYPRSKGIEVEPMLSEMGG